MFVQSNKRSLLIDGAFEDQSIIGASLTSLGCTKNVMTGFAQKRSQIDPQHLVKVKAHA